MSESETSKVYDAISTRADLIQNKTRNITIKPGYIGLCFQCQNAFIYRSSRYNDPTIQCREDYNDVKNKPLDILECNKFLKNGELEIWDLIKSSKVVDLSVQTAKVGFATEKEEDGIQKG